MIVASLTSMFFFASMDGVEKTLFQLERNEQAYSDLAMRVDFRYETNNGIARPDSLLSRSNERLWQVSSQGEYRLELTGRSSSVQDESELSSLIESHSEGITRIRSAITGKVVREHRGRGQHFVYPHSIVLRGGAANRPLSKFISGRYNSSRAKLRYLGKRTINGLLCHRLRVSGQNEPGEIDLVREFYLAEDRNYFPVRIVTYSLRYSKVIPSGIVSIDEFVEIAPGKWFPARGSYTAYDRIRIRDDQKQVWRWKTSFLLRGVDLSRNIPEGLLEFEP